MFFQEEYVEWSPTIWCEGQIMGKVNLPNSQIGLQWNISVVHKSWSEIMLFQAYCVLWVCVDSLSPASHIYKRTDFKILMASQAPFNSHRCTCTYPKLATTYIFYSVYPHNVYYVVNNAV